MKIKSILMRFDRPDANGLSFSKECGKQLMKQTEESLKDRALLVGLNLGRDPYYDCIDLQEAALNCTDLEMGEFGIQGEFETLDTPNGKVVEDLITRGGTDRFRVVPRAVEKIGENAVVESASYQFLSFDFVSEEK